MDEIFRQIIPGLGAFGPAALLAWWVINQQAKQIDAKDDRINQLSDRMLAATQAVAQALAELKAAVRGTE